MTRIFTLLLTVLAINLTASAQPLAERVPSDALLYVGWAGTQHLGEAYEKSHFKAVMRPDGKRGRFEAVARMVLPILEREEPDAAPIVMQLGKMLDRVIQYPTALYIGPPVINQDGPPMPRVALICKAGDDAAKLRDELQQWMRDAEAPIPVQVDVLDGELWLNFGATPPEDRASSLAGKAGFAGAFKGLVEQPVLAAYVDAAGLVTLVDQVAEAEASERELAQWQKLRDALGLNGIKRVVWAGGFADRDWETALFIEAPAPRKGIAGLLDSNGPIAPESLKMIPATASLAGGLRFDLDRLYAWGYDLAGKIEPDAQADIDKGMAQVKEMLGFDIRTDLMQGLGPDWVYYADRSVAGTNPMGLVVANRLRKPEARQAIEKLIAMGNAILAQQLEREQVTIEVRKFDHGKHAIHYLNTPLISPAFSVNDQRLLIGLYPQTVAAALDGEGKPRRGLGDASQFVVMKQKMGVPQVGAFQYADLPQLVGQTYPGVLMMNRLIPGIFDMTGARLPPMMVPPLNQLRPHLSPTASFSWADERGYHIKTRSPFPGASMFGTGMSLNQASVGSSALMLSILLPAINKSRDLANRAVSAANLKNISSACLIYAQSNNDLYPDDLGVLILDGTLSSKNLVHPASGKRPPPNLRSVKEIAAWAVKNSDYVYLGGSATMRGSAIVAYEKMGNSWTREGVNILFADGSVQWIRLARAKQLLAKQKAR